MKVERKQLIEIDLRSIRIEHWPNEARELASLILMRPRGKERIFGDLFPKGKLAAIVEAEAEGRHYLEDEYAKVG